MSTLPFFLKEYDFNLSFILEGFGYNTIEIGMSHKSIAISLTIYNETRIWFLYRVRLRIMDRHSTTQKSDYNFSQMILEG